MYLYYCWFLLLKKKKKINIDMHLIIHWILKKKIIHF